MADRPNVGNQAYEFELPDTQGKTWTLKDLLVQGDVMLFFFRGVW